ncbi:winged helix-turn-helix domain-containing protein [Azospirillum largimobile]
MSASLKIAEGMTAAALRHWARRCGNGRAAARAYAIANALGGLERAEAARLAGMERQALWDAVRRYNTQGGAGLFERPKGHRVEWLSEAEQAALNTTALAVWIATKFGKTFHPHRGGRILGRLGLSRQKARPVHPKTESKAQER